MTKENRSLSVRRCESLVKIENRLKVKGKNIEKMRYRQWTKW